MSAQKPKSADQRWVDRFSGKVVLVTGGTSGIGLATAIMFAEQGAESVVICGRTQKKWNQAQSQLQLKLTPERQSKIFYYQCDVRVEDDVKTMIHTIFTTFKCLDVCFNCAGVQPVNNGDITKMKFQSYRLPDGSIIYRLPPPSCDPSQSTPVSEFCESPIATSAIGVFYCLKWEIAYVEQFQPPDRPVSIINISSRNGVLPDAHRPLYAASKAFILSLTRSVASQLASKFAAQPKAYKDKKIPSIRVNAISPGPIDTPLERAAFSGSPSETPKASEHKFHHEAAMGVPMGRVGIPEEVAPSVLFLADNSMSSYITGSNLIVDGGHCGSPVLGSIAE